MGYGRWRAPYREASYTAGASIGSEKSRAVKRARNKHEVLLGYKDFVRYNRWFRHTPEGSTYPIKPPALD